MRRVTLSGCMVNTGKITPDSTSLLDISGVACFGSPKVHCVRARAGKGAVTH